MLMKTALMALIASVIAQPSNFNPNGTGFDKSSLPVIDDNEWADIEDMPIKPSDIGDLLGNNQTFDSPIVYCETFYPNMTLPECLNNKSDEYLNSKMFIDSLVSGNESMMQANVTFPPEMMKIMKDYYNISMG
jgi:hypothetical protein